MLADGPQNLSINEIGQQQVIDTIQILKKHPISCIFTSPLKRCLETAQMVSESLGHIPIFIVDELQERYFGDWSQCKEKAQALVHTAPDGPGFFQYIKQKIEKILPDDAESIQQFEKRIFLGITKALHHSVNYSSYPLIIGHGCVKEGCKKAMSQITGIDKPKLFTQPIFFSPSSNDSSWELMNLD